MAAEGAPTLREIFLARPGDAGPEGLGDAGGEQPLVELRSNLAEELPGVPWRAISEEIGTRVAEVLDVPIDEILVSAWKRLRELQTYRDRSRHPADEVILVPLGKHTVKSTHRPHVEVLLRDAPIGRLDFEIQLALEVEGVVLKIRDGRIWEIRAGSWRCKGTLEGRLAGQRVLERERTTKKRPLPGALRFAEGVEIPAL